ncbi:ABC transporter ATP-binding protein [Alkalimonas collagenimarina]|uniref:ABC transporter ATP-binding protein n=1 Tax=Alkalimonas collagenimarina TaxID=400390 RepID=A0ABT9GW71_9GAMM|nr:ABC transporter ATP-binding protein [Alkalimonas collagenimarina]MDP4535119.1 ABC transporter ATP-binding protein [Alkalimonas collagenimarina]
MSKRYRKGELVIDALKQVELSLDKGQLIAVSGPSGSGKSTLLNLIGLLDQPSAGTIELFGKRCESLNRAERQRMRRKYLGFIFQNFNLLPVLNAVENVELSLYGHALSKEKMRETALNMLRQVGLLNRAYHYPRELSGGQQQRVGIARALVHQPRLVMADEPTANLDTKSATDIIELMRLLSHEIGTTFLVSTHDPRLLKNMDREVTLTDGVLLS